VHVEDDLRQAVHLMGFSPIPLLTHTGEGGVEPAQVSRGEDSYLLLAVPTGALECCVCYEITLEPQQCANGHVLCLACAARLIGQPCPVCRCDGQPFALRLISDALCLHVCRRCNDFLLRSPAQLTPFPSRLCPRHCPRHCPNRCPLCHEEVSACELLEHAREKSHRVLQLPAIFRLVSGVPWRLRCLATRSDGTVLCIDEVRLEDQALRIFYRSHTSAALEASVSVRGTEWHSVVPGERLRECSYWLRLT
jgi:hypothetical protein